MFAQCLFAIDSDVPTSRALAAVAGAATWPPKLPARAVAGREASVR